MNQLLLPGLASLTPFRGQIFSPLWRGKFPHMMPLDIAIWRRFLDGPGRQFLGFQYDVTLGTGAVVPESFSEIDRRLLWTLTVKRADALGILRDRLVLFEVKPRLGMAAIGQVVSYVALWRRQYEVSLPVIGAWVGERSEPDLEFVARSLGIRLVLA